MESGGKAVTKIYRKKITVVLSLVLPVILLFAILNCFTTYVFYEDYKYKMNLMTEIAARKNFPDWMLFRNCLRIRILKLTNREGDYWSNMDTGGIKGMYFIRNSGIRLW